MVRHGSETGARVVSGIRIVERRAKSAADLMRFAAPLLDRKRVALDSELHAELSRSIDRWVNARLPKVAAEFVETVAFVKPLINSPKIRAALQPRTLERLRARLDAVTGEQGGATLIRPVKDSRAGADMRGFVRLRIIDRFGPQLARRTELLRSHRVSIAFVRQHGSPAALPLEQVARTSDRAVLRALRADLIAAQRGPPHLLVRRLVEAFNRRNSSGEAAVAAAIECVVEHIYVRGGGGTVHSKQRVHADLLQRLTRDLIGSVTLRNLTSVLPRRLPSLPKARSDELRRLRRMARSHGGPRAQLAFLERQAALLGGSPRRADRRRAERLTAYLASYKRGWISGWIEQRMELFAGSPQPVSWKLSSQLDYRGDVSAEQRQQLEQRLERAWTIIRGAVHPKLLARLPPVAVHVEAERKRAEHEGQIIRIGPKATVATILHEFGHHLEDYGDLELFALAHGLRQRRASGAAPVALRRLARGAGYEKHEVAYPGGFFHPYIGKRYDGGVTEVISVGLEQLASPHRAAAFAMRDGEYALSLLYALQHPQAVEPPAPRSG